MFLSFWKPCWFFPEPLPSYLYSTCSCTNLNSHRLWSLFLHLTTRISVSSPSGPNSATMVQPTNRLTWALNRENSMNTARVFSSIHCCDCRRRISLIRRARLPFRSTTYLPVHSNVQSLFHVPIPWAVQSSVQEVTEDVFLIQRTRPPRKWTYAFPNCPYTEMMSSDMIT